MQVLVEAPTQNLLKRQCLGDVGIGYKMVFPSPLSSLFFFFFCGGPWDDFRKSGAQHSSLKTLIQTVQTYGEFRSLERLAFYIFGQVLSCVVLSAFNICIDLRLVLRTSLNEGWAGKGNVEKE